MYSNKRKKKQTRKINTLKFCLANFFKGFFFCRSSSLLFLVIPKNRSGCARKKNKTCVCMMNEIHFGENDDDDDEVEKKIP